MGGSAPLPGCCVYVRVCVCTFGSPSGRDPSLEILVRMRVCVCQREESVCILYVCVCKGRARVCTRAACAFPPWVELCSQNKLCSHKHTYPSLQHTRSKRILNTLRSSSRTFHSSRLHVCLSQIEDLPDVDELVKSPEEFYADSEQTEIMDEVLNYLYWKWGKRERLRVKRLGAYSCFWLELGLDFDGIIARRHTVTITTLTYPCDSPT